jgi:general stress protein 26
VSGPLDIIENYYTCELTTLSRDGSPQTWLVTRRLLTDGRLLFTTSIGLSQKAFNVRRNPQVSLLFSEPTGSGVAEPGAVLLQGDATAADDIVTGMSSDPDLAALLKRRGDANPRARSGVRGWAGDCSGRITCGS